MISYLPCWGPPCSKSRFGCNAHMVTAHGSFQLAESNHVRIVHAERLHNFLPHESTHTQCGFMAAQLPLEMVYVATTIA